MERNHEHAMAWWIQLDTRHALCFSVVARGTGLQFLRRLDQIAQCR
jgi:hypothetical protein